MSPTKMNSKTITTSSCCAMMALAVIALSSCPSVESLAFDISSRSSSTFTSSSSNSQISFFPHQCESSTSTTTSTSSSQLTMKVNGQKSRNRQSKSSYLIEQNNQRLQTAGRPGTKKFQDPNKVFCGNLPFDASEEDISELFSRHYNCPLEAVGDRIESIKIIRDWKTGKSKGYGFIQFYDTMTATSAMESVNKGKGKGWRIKGRKIRLDQGVRTPSEEDDYAKKKKKKQEQKALDEEGMVIHSVLADVEGSAGDAAVVSGVDKEDDDEEDEEDDGMMSEDDMITFMEKGGLRGVMPLTEETAGFLGIEGLYDDDKDDFDFEEFYNENGYSDGDFEEGEEGDIDGEEIVYDGVFEEEYNPKEFEGMTEEEEEAQKKMNREQRREANKKRKKRKLPFRGFGAGS